MLDIGEKTPVGGVGIGRGKGEGDERGRCLQRRVEGVCGRHFVCVMLGCWAIAAVDLVRDRGGESGIEGESMACTVSLMIESQFKAVLLRRWIAGCSRFGWSSCGEATRRVQRLVHAQGQRQGSARWRRQVGQLQEPTTNPSQVKPCERVSPDSTS